MRGPAALAAVAMLLLAGCADDPPEASGPAPTEEVGLAGRAPRIDAPSIVEGERVTTPATGGYLVNFWGSWCEPCKRELPRLVAARAPVVGVAVRDSSRRARESLAAAGATWPSAADPDARVAAAWGLATGYPVTVAVGPDGTIRKKHFGELGDADIQDLLALIR